jgi:cell division protein ZapA
MEERHAVRVSIFGSEYTIRGEADGEYIRELARYVDGKMQEIARNTGLTIPLKVGILAAINLADEIYRLRAARKDQENPAENMNEKPAGVATEAIAALCAHIEEALQEE